MLNTNTKPRHVRDPRVDFFRGLALIFIFVDHIPDNAWAYATLKNFGFADASEVFVLLSGYSAALAYGLGTKDGPLNPSFRRALKRASHIYLWHLAIFASSVVLLFAAAEVFGNRDYIYNIWLQNLETDPALWTAKALVLYYQPNQMNILPLYVALMLWFPVMLILFRRGVFVALAVSFMLWAGANYFKINLPANEPGYGWFFNPLAWQLLFTTGAAAAVLGNQHQITGRNGALIIAFLYVAFSFIYAAPWVPISWLPDSPLLPSDFILTVSKPDLSAWRFLHVLALAYLAGSLIQPAAPWLGKGLANMIVLVGRNAIEIFALGTLLSFVGWIVLAEIGVTAARQLAVTITGIAVMAATATWLGGIKAARERGVATAPA